MRLRLNYILFVLLFAHSAFSQIRVIAPVKAVSEKRYSSLGFGAGLTRSVVYLPRNTANNNDARGTSYIITFDKGNFIRYTLEYNYYNSINITPTWFNVKATSLESNIQIIARFNDGHSYFYPLIGLSYNHFSGYFTGINDFTNLRSIHQPNSTVTSNWLGLNTGVGYDYNFKHSAIYLTYKMRVGYTEGYGQYNIQDICISAGYRFYLSGPEIKKLFRGTRSRYVLSKPKDKN